MGDTLEEIRKDIEAIGRIDAVPALLRIVSDTTQMGFAAVAKVTEDTWTACAVHDLIGFGLKPGDQLDLETTLCKEVREARTPIVIDHASADSVYCKHQTPKRYAFESYVSVPIVLSDGSYFGNLCAIDPRPAKVSDPRTLAMFVAFARLIGLQLDAERRRVDDQAALLDARTAAELREQFMAILGHDLRNPLAAILVCTKLLRAQARNQANITQTVARIDQSARRMSDLISDVLDLARVRLGGGLGLTIEEVQDLEHVLRKVAQDLQQMHPAGRIDCEIDIRGSVYCDVNRIEQLASNLLGNALTHGAQATPVTLRARTEDDTLVLEVANQGEPIPQEDLSRVLEPFWRRNVFTHHGGLGLGLYICDQIAKAHGGTLVVNSSRESGTTVTARLPVRPPGG